MRRGLVGLGAALTALVFASAVQAAVTPTTCGNLAADMNAASAGQVLQLPAGICHVNVTVNNTAAFTLKGATGGGTVLEPQTGQSSTPIIQSSADVHFTLSGLELTGATAGALVLFGNEAVTLTGNTFTQNSSVGGAGGAVKIEANGTTPEPTVITGNTFSHDSADSGGGLYWFSGQPLMLRNNTFLADSGTFSGGGAALGNSLPTTNPVQISGNTFGGPTVAAGDTSEGQGGGADVSLATGQPLTIIGNRFENDRITGIHTANGPREGAGLWLGLNAGTGQYPVTQASNLFSGNVIDETEASGRSTDTAGGAGEWISGVTAQSTADVFGGNRIAVNDGAPPEGAGVGAFAAADAFPVPAEPASFVGREDLFSGNSTAAGGWGGAIYVGGPNADCSTPPCPGSSVALQDSTVVGNSVDAGAGSEGGAIWGSPNDHLAVGNSVIFGNTPKPEVFGFASHPPVVSHSDVCGVSGAGDICQDPKLAASGAETKASPTIDVGSNALVPAGLTRDLVGNPRIAASRVTCKGPGPAIVDMGAFESTLKLVPSCDPKVQIKSKKLSVKHGKTKVKLSCPGGYLYCDGTVTITTGKGKKLGSAHFHIADGKSVKVTVTLSGKELAKLGSPGAVKVKVKVKDHDGLHHKAKSHRALKLKLA